MINTLIVTMVLLISAGSVSAQIPMESDEAGWQAFRVGNYEAAQRIWQPKASQGDGEAALGMAILFENGLGMAKDIKQSAYWYEIAANKGIPEAQHDLGIKYFAGSGVKQNNDRAYNLWKAAAEAGLGSAQAKLAYLYTQGIGTGRDYDEAVRWYRQAIKQNNGEAMYNLSLLYQDGTGVRQDKLQFLHWLEQAAIYGYSRAQYDLGLMLIHGLDIEKSVSNGKKWLLEAANNGLIDAQYYLGTLYLNGHIIAPDREKAMILLNDAARQGHQGAKQTLLDLQLADSSNGIKLGLQPQEQTVRKTAPATAQPGSGPPAAGKPAPIILSGKAPVTQAQTDIQDNQTSWLSQQDSDAFTIQLLASQDLAAVKKYHASIPSTLNAYTFSYYRGGKLWHAVAAGVHPSYDHAAAALKKFPKHLKKTKPWIRKISQLKEIINKS